MRISDWSSDVCSSDLFAELASIFHHRDVYHCGRSNGDGLACISNDGEDHRFSLRCLDGIAPPRIGLGPPRTAVHGDSCPGYRTVYIRHHPGNGLLCMSRSEEHTSELQSLMRISYAVFCLKKTINHFQPR